MKRCALPLLLAATGLAAGAAPARAESPQEQPAPPAALLALIPAGQELLAWARADLNLDGRPDVVFILQPSGSHPYDGHDRGEQPRPLVVALGQSDGRLREASRNLTLVRCQNCGGTWPEPFESLSARRGSFSLGHYGGSRWRWSDAWTFTWDPARRDWLLSRHSDGADTEDQGHLLRQRRRGLHFGPLRLHQVDGDTFLTRQVWPHAPPPPARRDPQRD